MKLSRLLTAINVTCDTPDTEITGVFCDSRRVLDGSIFVCLRGSIDGHDFAPAAEKNGAALIVAEHKTDSALPHVIVPDTREAMFYLSARWFGDPQKTMRFVGVTGTNGKTSTAYYIKGILDSLGCKTGLIGTVANMIGDRTLPSNATTPEPYTLCELLRQMSDEGVEYVVMEVSSHSLHQKRVCGIRFDTAVFTNLTQDHLDYHGTMENYKAAKTTLFENADTAVLNVDDEMGVELFEKLNIKKYTYSRITNSADFVAKEIKLTTGGVNFLAVTMGSISRVSVPSPGAFTVSNALAAIAAVHALGIPLDEISPHIGKINAVVGRAEIISGERPYTVMIDYAHTPDGLENILNSVRTYAKGRVVTLFGCGGDRDRTKRPIMGDIAARLSDFVILTSDNPRTEDPTAIIDDVVPGISKHTTPCVIIPDRREAIAYAIDNAQTDDVIILAGKGHENYQIIGKEKFDFDEHAIALKYMENKRK